MTTTIRYKCMKIAQILTLLAYALVFYMCKCDNWEYKLVSDLLSTYDSSIRPSIRHNSTLNVTFGLALAQIIDVDERNMIITTNCWLNQGWIDNKLKWNPLDYDGIEFIHVPSEKIWKPDILLVNNADSWAKISSISTNAMIRYNGNVTWLSTVIFKSSCSINVRFFPFDEQHCDMIFASWTFDGFFLDIDVNSGEGDLTNYIKNGEWHLVRLTAWKNLKNYSCCPEPYPEIYYRLVIRRRPLFYVFNMVFPCLLITLVAFLGFYLPPGSTEKVSIGITTLLSITVFLMLVAESMPPTSEQLPLLGIYYGVTIGIVSFSTSMAVITLNVNNKGQNGKRVPRIVRIIYFDYLAKIFRSELSSKARRNFFNSDNFYPSQAGAAPAAVHKTSFKMNTTTVFTEPSRKFLSTNEIIPLTNLIHEKKNRIIDTLKRVNLNSIANEPPSVASTNSSAKLIEYADVPSNPRPGRNQRKKLAKSDVCYDTLILEAATEDDFNHHRHHQRYNHPSSFSRSITKTPPSGRKKSSEELLNETTTTTSSTIINNEKPNGNNKLLLKAASVSSRPSSASYLLYDNCGQSSLDSNETSRYNHQHQHHGHAKVKNQSGQAQPHQGKSKRREGGASLRKTLSANYNINTSMPVISCAHCGGEALLTANEDDAMAAGMNLKFIAELEHLLNRQFSPLVERIIETLNKNELLAQEKLMLTHIQNEWADVACISDHILCYFFPILTIATCLYIFFTSPHVLDNW